VATAALAVHLYHGTWSLFQSLGINNPKYNAARRRLAQTIALVVFVGNVSFPIAVLTGVVENACDTGHPTAECNTDSGVLAK
jgi:succinate dehydrogenase / fumarate reductase cytochrome b subunit